MKTKLNFDKTYHTSIISEHELKAEDIVDGCSISNETQQKSMADENKQKLVHNIIKDNILNFKKKRTIERKVVENIVSEFIREEFNISDIKHIYSIILNNKDFFANLIQASAQRYKNEKDNQNKNKLGIKQKTWKPSTNLKYNSEQHEEMPYKKYAYTPCLLRKNRPKNEKEFERYIDGLDKVVWWSKNGNSGQMNFGVSYINDESETHIFYPDYIIKTKNNVYILDTKDGIYYNDCGPKAKALYEYCKKKRYISGIVKKVGSVWKVNSGKKFDHTKEDQLKVLRIR